MLKKEEEEKEEEDNDKPRTHHLTLPAAQTDLGEFLFS